ncbi:TetR/AcrR family transcriptional regulator [Actinomycetospora sp. TBRC 11914]|uniref:TetR/AcrR family transcriptional regulator n=1 Tax=Actinomycetospora sp. TBRC 11914 TaxID=2729387 RepID=UPI00145E4615|nr:TetR/AcrR family transcriptional regulator [Actinomycetospora sp. TBRC 11914]NMO92459.1 TetR/AcrR family transcriptional regulator [Actinomycetospora sp. TBRC 11914]
MTSTDARGRRRPADKFEDRRRELADAALQTLATLGYARTSLREIAQNSDFSHGVLHYYFRDKVELITYCVQRFKTQCVERYDAVATHATAADALARDAGDGLAATLESDALMHRLWYDLRSQSMFEESFRLDVGEIDAGLERMIWRIVTTYAHLSGREPACTSATAYAAFDGLFQQALLRHLAADPEALDDLRAGTRLLLERLV